MTLLPALHKGQLHSVCAFSCCPPIPLEQGNAKSTAAPYTGCSVIRRGDGQSKVVWNLQLHALDTDESYNMFNWA